MARSYKRDSRGRFAGGGGGSSGGRKSSTGKRSTPKTTTARGRALQNQRRASDLVRAGRGGSGPSKKAVRSAVTAMRARAYYAATGSGTKRSASKKVSAAKKGKQIRAEGRAKAATERAKSAGRVRSGAAAKTPRQPLTMEQRKAKLLQVHGRAMEADLSKRKGLTRYQVRDILDAGSAATVVRNVKKWVGRNRGSMAASGSTSKPRMRRSKPAPLRPGYNEVVTSNKRKLQSLNRQIRQGGPGTLQMRTERRMLRVKIAGLESQGRLG